MELGDNLPLRLGVVRPCASAVWMMCRSEPSVSVMPTILALEIVRAGTDVRVDAMSTCRLRRSRVPPIGSGVEPPTAGGAVQKQHRVMAKPQATFA